MGTFIRTTILLQALGLDNWTDSASILRLASTMRPLTEEAIDLSCLIGGTQAEKKDLFLENGR